VSIGHDIEAFNILLQSKKSDTRIPSFSGKDGESVSNLDVSLRKHLDKISSDDVHIISERVRSCSKGISELPKSEHVTLLLQVEKKSTSLHRKVILTAFKNSKPPLTILLG